LAKQPPQILPTRAESSAAHIVQFPDSFLPKRGRNRFTNASTTVGFVQTALSKARRSPRLTPVITEIAERYDREGQFYFSMNQIPDRIVKLFTGMSSRGAHFRQSAGFGGWAKRPFASIGSSAGYLASGSSSKAVS
jgi:hypothetical protein